MKSVSVRVRILLLQPCVRASNFALGGTLNVCDKSSFISTFMCKCVCVCVKESIATSAYKKLMRYWFPFL